MKSCLKRSTPESLILYQTCPGSPEQNTTHDHHKPQKSVTFSEAGEEEVFYVDDWDRSPAAVTERLTYKDVYELKEMRMALPRLRLAAEPRIRQAAASTPTCVQHAIAAQ